MSRHSRIGRKVSTSDGMIQDSIATGQLYVLSDGAEIAACVIANDEKVDDYADARAG